MLDNIAEMKKDNETNSVFSSTTSQTPTYSSASAYDTANEKNTIVENIQKSLNSLGYTGSDGNSLKVDSDFGEKTQSAWNNFILDKGVTNYLNSIATTPTSVGNYLVNTNNPIQFQEPKSASISMPTGNEYIFTGSMLGDYRQNFGSENDTLMDSDNNSADLLSESASIIGGLWNKDIVLNSPMEAVAKEVNETNTYGGKAVSAIGIAIPIAESFKYAIDGDEKSAVVKLGGVAAAIPVIAGIAGSMLGEEITEWVYDKLS